MRRCTSLLCCCAFITSSSVTCSVGSAGANSSPSSSVSPGAVLAAPACPRVGTALAGTSTASVVRLAFRFFVDLGAVRVAPVLPARVVRRGCFPLFCVTVSYAGTALRGD
ncbi:hypothetical protein PR002_g32861, partial [Phytophthora rubi]